MKFWVSLCLFLGLAGDLFAQCNLPIPSGFKAINITNCSVDLSWKSVSGAASYKVQYRVVGTSSWMQSAPLTGLLTTVSGLISNTPYEFQVASFCDDKNTAGFSASINKTTKKCSAPLNFFAAA